MRHLLPSWPLLLICILLLLTGAGALPGPSVPRAQARQMAQAAVPITNRTHDQTLPAIAYNSQRGDYLVVWEHEYSTDDHDIYARRVASDGSPKGLEFAISQDTSLEEIPDVAYNSAADEFLVVWEYTSSDWWRDIYAQRVSSDGVLMGSAILVSATLDTRTPAVVYNAADDEYLIVWVAGDRIEGIWRDVCGQRLDANGTLLGSRFVIDTGLDNVRSPDVAYDSRNVQYLVAWQKEDWTEGSHSYDIYGRRVRRDGVPLGGEIPISTWEYDQLTPRLAFNSVANEFLVVWEDHHWGWGNDWDIFGQRIKADGTLTGGLVGVSWEGANHREQPEVAYNTAANEFMVVWEYEYSSSDHDVYSRRLASDGTVLEDEIAISRYTSYEGQPAVATANQGGTYLIVWEDGRDAASQGLNIYGYMVEGEEGLSHKTYLPLILKHSP